MTDTVIGIDVGTGSARAGVFDLNGRLLGQASRDIQMWKPAPDFVEQSSDDIWNAVCVSVRDAMAKAEVGANDVKGLGFDATCSLVVLDERGAAVTVDPDGDDDRNVIVWMDHRAIPEAERINAGGHEVLRYVGGAISPEMETPKLVWLKNHMPETWARAAHFFDLPDYLTWKATGSTARSLCSTVCKWTYLGHENRWDDAYFRGVGLDDLADEGFSRIGTEVRPMGAPVGSGLSAEAARDLGLVPGIPVGTSIIDAHAGGLGMVGAAIGDRAPTAADLETRLALIGGTSSCHMAVSAEPRFVPGVWGPYYSAMVPDLWLNEGGQSATGALVDHLIRTHTRGVEAEAAAKVSGRTVYEVLNERLDVLARDVDHPAALTRDRHVLPYFHGNRSPRANPTLRGIVTGLALADTVDDLALTYLATIQGIAHGTRHIVDAMRAQGYRIDTILACGGGTKNPVFLREHADATGCRIVLPKEPEAMLLGSAMLGAVAGGCFGSVVAAMGAMSRAERVIEPATGAVTAYHDAKHAVFKRLHDDLMAYRKLMDGA